MCTGGAPSVPTAPAIEPQKAAQASMDGASDATLRSQMMRRGVYSLFSQKRGYGNSDSATTTAASDTKSDVLG